MKRKIILMQAYEAFKNKGVDLEPCASLDDLFLEAFAVYEECFKEIDDFYTLLRYECDIETGEIEEHQQLICESGKYKLVRNI